ncbi:MAG: M20/M25/M40 family metallo-hydrolase [Clostridia bacterium]|nr:M20/M25/M40 family metallo-hydrolase [Clostridia bacterium]
MKLDCYEEVKALTEALVEIPSVTGETGGESAVAKYIRDWYHALPYFKKYPERATVFKTANDSVDRHCALTWIRGEGGDSSRTVILIGHIDTVGMEDYGTLKALSVRPAELAQRLRETFDLPPHVLEDMDSGEFMFGRGVLDMKSGVAGHMAVMKYFSEHPEELCGNLVHIAECDEEDNSHGILTALDVLAALKREQGFEYIACINSDYSTFDSAGDPTRYIYFGSIGKLLPCYVAFGKEAHVGASFQAFDPNLLIAEVTRELCLNADFCDEALGEVTLPPVSLKQSDTKERYTVQTALCAYGYYNFFTHGRSPAEVLELCRKAGERAFERTVEHLDAQYKKYCGLAGKPYEKLPWKPRVMTWKEFYAGAEAQHGEPFRKAVRELAQRIQDEQPDTDLRQLSLRLTEEVWKWYSDKSPALVLLFGSIYYPRIQMGGSPGELALQSAVELAVEKVAPQADRKIKTKMFYPYISDMSFMSVCDDAASFLPAAENMPAAKAACQPDMEKMLAINVPVVNIGSFGHDGHMLTERVDMLHTFRNVPNITYETLRELLK